MIHFFLRAHTVNGEKMVKVDHYPFTIGRYELADLCLQDESISSIHARIELRTIKDKDHAVIVDNQSRNGLFCDGKKINEKELKAGKDIYIGLVKLEVISGSVFSEQTREINISEYLDFKFNLKKYLYAYIPLSYLFYILVRVFESYLTSPINSDEWSDFLISNTKYLIGSFIFALGLAFVSKLNNKHYKFHQFLWICNVAIASVILYNYIYPYLFQIIWIETLTYYLYPYGTVFILFYFALILGRMVFENIARLKLNTIFTLILFLSITMMTVVKNMRDEALTLPYNSHFAYPLSAWQQEKSYETYNEFERELDTKFLKVHSKRKRP